MNSYTEYFGIDISKQTFDVVKKDIDLSVVNPTRIKRFSQMTLNRNKTDKSDAKMISSYAQNQEIELWSPAPDLIEQGKI